MEHCKAHFDNLKELTQRMSDIVTALKTLNCDIFGRSSENKRETYAKTERLLRDELCNLAMSVYIIGCGAETPESGYYAVSDHSEMFGMLDIRDPRAIEPRS